MSVYCPSPDLRTMLCTRCGRPCEPRVNGWQHARERCGAILRNAKVPCGRFAGHRDSHRSPWAMEYDAHRRVAA